MRPKSNGTRPGRIAVPALGWAALGVLAFSFTFPATALAERSLDPYLVGAGRSVLAAMVAGSALIVSRARLPGRDCWTGLVAVAVGCGIGFGVLSALALRHTSSSHAAVVIGLLPIATALVAVLRAGERPGWQFWAGSGAGTAAVVVYALSRGRGGVDGADLLLLAGLVVAAIGYAEGGRLAKVMPGWQVIAWGVLLALPVSLPIAVVAAAQNPPAHIGVAAIVGFAYLGLVSMFLGFLAWYRGLAHGGVARASQLQLVQPLLTVAWSALLLGDRLGTTGLITAVVVVACVLVTQTASRSTAGRNRAREAPDRHRSSQSSPATDSVAVSVAARVASSRVDG